MTLHSIARAQVAPAAGADALIAQQPSGAATPAPGRDGVMDGKIGRIGKTYTLRVTTREVMVEVVALDRHNHPVSDMKASDFQIFEVGTGSQRSAQAVTAFHVVDPALETEQMDAPSAGSRVTLGGGCAMSTAFHYQLAYHASSEGWTSGYHEVLITTGRSGVRLSYHRRYYVGVTDLPAKPPPQNDAKINAILQQTACFHSETPSSISLTARSIQSAITEPLRFSLTVKADALAFTSLTDETQRVQFDYGICIFDQEGKALRYMHTSAERVLGADEYEQVRAHGFPYLLEFTRAGGPGLARFVVRDRETGNLGSIEVLVAPPAPAEVSARAQAALDAAAGRTTETTTAAHATWPQSPLGTFGSIIPTPNTMCGDVYELTPGIRGIPDFETMDTVGALYTYSLNLPYQFVSGGLPGVTSRYDWFSIDYHGEFWVKNPGEYGFEVSADDGAQLYIDDNLLFNQDMPTMGGGRSIKLAAGRHTIHLPYFQGPQHVVLILQVKPPGEDWRAFDLRDFPPPPDFHVTSRVLPGFEVVQPLP